jgi:hypothetical protein
MIDVYYSWNLKDCKIAKLITIDDRFTSPSWLLQFFLKTIKIGHHYSNINTIEIFNGAMFHVLIANFVYPQSVRIIFNMVNVIFEQQYHFGKQNMPLIANTCVHFLVCQVMSIKVTTH